MNVKGGKNEEVGGEEENSGKPSRKLKGISRSPKGVLTYP